MSERAAYSRVYWSIVDDAKFASVYDNDHHLAAWLRLLLIADQAHPASAHLPANVRRTSVRVLSEVELIDLLPGQRYRVHGLDAERERRRVAATSRPPKGGHPSPAGPRPVPERSPNGSGTTGLSLAEPRQDEPSQADAREERDILDDFYRLTARFPSGNTKDWLIRIQNEFGLESSSRMLAAVFAADPSPKTLLSRLENELRSAAHAAERRSQEREVARLDEWNRTRALTPEQIAENQRRMDEIKAQWQKPAEAKLA